MPRILIVVGEDGINSVFTDDPELEHLLDVIVVSEDIPDPDDHGDALRRYDDGEFSTPFVMHTQPLELDPATVDRYLTAPAFHGPEEDGEAEEAD